MRSVLIKNDIATFAIQPRDGSYVDQDLFTPHGTVSTSVVLDKTTILVTGSGPQRGRWPDASVQKIGPTSAQKRVTEMTRMNDAGNGSTLSNADLSLHHIDSIKTLSDFGSPTLL